MAKTSDPDQLRIDREKKLKYLHTRAEEEQTKAFAEKLSLPYFNSHSSPIDGVALTLRPLDTQKIARVALVKKSGTELIVATTSPEGPDFKKLIGSLEDEDFIISVVIVSKSGLQHVWDLYAKFAYLNMRIAGEVSISDDRLIEFMKEISTLADITERLEAAGPEDVSIIVELILGSAARVEASDIHAEPQKNGMWHIRYRIDGVLHDIADITKAVATLLLGRIKLLASMKLNVHDNSQDGRFTIHLEDRDIEVRASSLPGPLGEYIVLRLLDPRTLIDIPELGMRDIWLEQIKQELARPNGMILTTGPTGSGKTTMLYAFVRRVATEEIKVIGIEDPIEYKLAGIEQTQVDDEEGYTFAKGLRSIVRQDPDVILIGEIRDYETAEIALQSALTGHLVFSTLHTNDAAGAFPRLAELGTNPAIAASAINLVIAQRLVRKLCKDCKQAYHPDKTLVEEVRTTLSTLPKQFAMPISTDMTLYKSQACHVCRGTGYRGRMGVFELFSVGDAAEDLITKNASTAEIRKFAISQGMVVVQQDALLRMLEGITSLHDVIRVTGPLRHPHEEIKRLHDVKDAGSFRDEGSTESSDTSR